MVPSRLLTRSVLPALVALVAITSALAAEPYLVADLRTRPRFGFADSSPFFNGTVNGVALFQCTAPGTPTALWRTDGTDQGTYQLLTFDQGSPRVIPIATSGNTAYFTGVRNGTWGIWKTDGTKAGTSALTSSISNTSSIFIVGVAGGNVVFMKNDTQLFAADSGGGVHVLNDSVRPGTSAVWTTSFTWKNKIYIGLENSLWRTDGTQSGTVKLSSNPAWNFAGVGDRVYFSGTAADSGSELWSTDGTAAGTHIVADLLPGAGSTLAPSKSAFAALGNNVFFLTSNGELGVSDGTAGGTALIRKGTPVTSPNVAVLGGAAYFPFNDGSGVALWRSDGTAAGTRRVGDPSANPSAQIYAITAGATRLYYSGYVDALQHYELFESDGTAEGTYAIRPPGEPFVKTSSSPMVTIGDTVFLSADDGYWGMEPWVSDSSAAGTHMIANLAAEAPGSSQPANFVAGSDRLFFTAVGDRPQDTLWSTDGTAAGTTPIFQTVDATNAPLPKVVVGRWLYLASGSQIWRSDGTPGSTTLVYDFGPSATIEWIDAGGRLDVRVNGSAQIWQTDGTPAGTVKLYAPAGSRPTPAVTIAGQPYWGGDDAFFTTDGTPAGTRPLVSSPVAADSYATRVAFHGSLLIFASGKIYKYSGAAGEGGLVTDVGSMFPASSVVSIGSTLLVLWQPQVTHYQLWKTDGTAGGTALVKDFPASGPSAMEMVTLGNRAVFKMDDGVNGVEPWVSDGTPEGTKLLRDINPSGSSAPAAFVAADGIAYFGAADPEHGRELWQTDGTPEGTRLVADIVAGSASSQAAPAARAGNLLYLTATTPDIGTELWAYPLGTTSIGIDDGFAAESAGQVTLSLRLTQPSTRRITASYETADDSAKAGRDYTATSGSVTFEAGETVKSISIPIADDSTPGVRRSFLVRVTNADVPISGPVGAGIIDDDDRVVDVALSLTFGTSGPVVVATNNGPSTATNVRFCKNDSSSRCVGPLQLAPGETTGMQVQQDFNITSFSASVTEWERDAKPANNVLTWTTPPLAQPHGMFVAPSVPHVGETVTLYLTDHVGTNPIALASSDPSVIAVPASASVPSGANGVSVAVTALKSGTTTISANAGGNGGTSKIDVRVLPTTDLRATSLLSLFSTQTYLIFGQRNTLSAQVTGVVPGGAQPTGSITLLQDDKAVATVPIATLPVVIPIDAFPGGHQWKAVYSGDARYLDASGTYSNNVLRATPSMSAYRITGSSDVRVVVRGVGGYAPAGTVTVAENIFAPPRLLNGPLVKVDDSSSAATVSGIPSSAQSVDVAFAPNDIQFYTSTRLTIPIVPDTRPHAAHH